MSEKLNQLFFKFKPIYKNVPWGGTQIAKFKGIEVPGTDIGESWEISGVKQHESIVAEGEYANKTLDEIIALNGNAIVGSESISKYGYEFPLLVKFIDANDNLSVQVHPDDELANERHGCCGKNEMWYVIDAKPDAQMYIGLNRQITTEEYDTLVARNEIINAISHHTTKAGNSYFIPAGCIHSIGAGNLLLEIQQASDISYRIYDFDRKDSNGNHRELHIQLAKEAINFNAQDDSSTECVVISTNETQLVNCPWFDVHKIEVEGIHNITQRDKFTVIVCLRGSLEMAATNADIADSTSLSQGQTVLVAADAKNIKLQGKATIVTATI